MSAYVLDNGFNNKLLTKYFDQKRPQKSKKNNAEFTESKLKLFVINRYKTCSLTIDDYSEFNTYFNVEESLPNYFKCDMIRPPLPILPKNPTKCATLGKYFLQFGTDVYHKFAKSLQNSKEKKSSTLVDKVVTVFVNRIENLCTKNKNGNQNPTLVNGLETIINTFYKFNCTKIMDDYNLFYEFNKTRNDTNNGELQTPNCDFFVRSDQSTKMSWKEVLSSTLSMIIK